MGKKWKRLLVQRRNEVLDAPAVEEPVVLPVVEESVPKTSVEEPVVKNVAPKPKRKRTPRKTTTVKKED